MDSETSLKAKRRMRRGHLSEVMRARQDLEMRAHTRGMESVPRGNPTTGGTVAPPRASVPFRGELLKRRMKRQVKRQQQVAY